jgi:hypothetical protein
VQKKAVLAGAVVGGLVLFFIFSNPNAVPRVDVDEDVIVDLPANNEPIDPGTPPENVPEPSIVTGDFTYKVTLNFEDGSKKTFSHTVSIGELPLNSISAGGKKLTRIDVEALANIDLPDNVGPEVTRTMYVESTASMLLNGQTIGAKSFSNYINFERLNGDVQLWAFSVPASSISLPTGTYAFSLLSTDSLRFVVAGENRILKVGGEPITFGMESDAGLLKELYVATYSPAAAASLEMIPITSSTGEVRSYTSNVVVKASGFKPASEITFTYIDRSLNPAPQTVTNSDYSVLLGKGQVKLMSDLAGGAVDRTLVKSGYSKPDPERYYAHFIVSDGENYAFGKAGLSDRESEGKGENPGFYVWPPMKNGVIDMERVDALIAKGGPFLRDPT